MNENKLDMAEAAAPPPRTRIWFDADTAAAIALALVYAAITIALAYWIRLSEALDIRGVESAVVWHVRELMLGRSLYPALDAPPFPVNQYTPVYYWILGGLSSVLGADPADPLSIFRAGRLLSLFFSTMTCGVLFYIARSIFVVSRTAAASGAIVATAWIFPWNMIARSDSLYFLLCALTGWFFLRYMSGAPKTRFALFAICSLIAAFFTKQSALCMAAAMALTVVVLCRGREIRQLVVMAIVPVAATLLLTAFFGSESFLQHILGGVSNGIDPMWTVRHAWVPLISTYQVALIAAAASLLGWSTAKHDLRALMLVIFGCLIFGILLSLKWGSTVNYFNEFFLFTGILYAVHLDRIIRWLGRHSILSSVAIGVNLLLVIGAFGVSVAAIDELRGGRVRAERQLAAAVAMHAGEGENATPVITNNERLVLFIKGPVWLPQYAVWASSVLTGKIDPQAAIQNAPKAIAVLRDESCPYAPVNGPGGIAGRVNVFTKKMFENFEVVDRSSGYCILRHR